MKKVILLSLMSAIIFSGCVFKVTVEGDPEYVDYRTYKEQKQNQKFIVDSPTIYLDEVKEKDYIFHQKREVVIIK